MLDNDADAVHAAWNASLNEGDVARDLRAWRVPCLIFAGDGDADFYADASRAADEIPGARFVSLTGRNHITGHAEVDGVLPAILEMLEADPRYGERN
jgi:pimeloyl-ACP methyl ester carboxylesterase